MAGRLVDVGLLLFTGEGLRPNQVEPESSVVDSGMLGEEIGFDSIRVIDRLRWNISTGPHGFWEYTSIAAALAAVTSRVRLLTADSGSPFRNTALVAKIAETIDMISDGRLMLGLGASSGPPEEYESFGAAQDHLHSRIAEAIEVISSLLREGQCDFDGTFYEARDCVATPRTPTRGSPDRCRR